MSFLNFIQGKTNITYKQEELTLKPVVGEVLLKRGCSYSWLKVESDTKLTEIEKQLASLPAIELICVMQPSGVITGIISRKELYHHLAVRVVPDKILSRIISERYPRKYLECVLNLKAGDIMKKPVLLHQENDLEEVFCIMQNSGAEILPVLDRSGQLINCLHLHDLLSYWSQNSQNN